MSPAPTAPRLASMPRAGSLVARDVEVAELLSFTESARAGRGAVVLLAGEAGAGKTRLATEVAARCGLLTLNGGAPQQGCEAYAPLAAPLRAYIRQEPRGLEDVGPLAPFLAAILPELGTAPAAGDAATLREALYAAFRTIGRRTPVLVFLDDLQWADHATLETLAGLSLAVADEHCLLLCAYRNDEIPRGHALRRLRRDLRRANRLYERVLDPLDEAGTAALAAQVIGSSPDRQLREALFARTHGLPFFVEELAAALVAAGRVRRGKTRATLAEREGDLPVPDSVREAITLRIAGLSDESREALEVAAVTGLASEIDVVADLAGEAGLEEAIQYGLLQELGDGRASFRHALTREAIYGDVPWTRRRKLHRLLAERLELREVSRLVSAEHWLAAREFQRAAPALAEAAAQFATVHAYSDALAAGRRAAEVWPDGTEEAGRLILMARLGRWAQLAGQFAEAAAAWRELADRRRLAGDTGAVGEAESQLATAYELQGALELALTARRAAATAFSRAGRAGEAATELLVAAAQLDSSGSVGAAVQLADRALVDARSAGRRDLEARALGIQGTARAKLGEIDAGVTSARAALDLALQEDLTASAAESYQRLANALEQAGDYRKAWDAYQAGFDYCEARGERAAAHICLVCLAAILFFTGEWERALRLDRRILKAPDSPIGTQMGAKQHMGMIGAARGDVRHARPLLLESGAYAARFERQRMEVWDALAHGWLDEAEGETEAALARCRFILGRWGESESVHYPLPALRWATTFCAASGAETEARACAAAVSRLAEQTVNPEVLSGLAHVLGEVALLDGEAEQAAARFLQALQTLGSLQLPFEAAQTNLRAGTALVRAGDRERGIEKLGDAYRMARKLRAAPLADRAARELAALGEAVEQRLGRRAAERLGGPQLTRRELEIMRMVASGRTNREIAGDLFLSTRTVDMHVRNILGKLRCRSRAEATRKAAELGLIA